MCLFVSVYLVFMSVCGMRCVCVCVCVCVMSVCVYVRLSSVDECVCCECVCVCLSVCLSNRYHFVNIIVYTTYIV